MDFISQLRDVDLNAMNAIKDLLKNAGITQLDINYPEDTEITFYTFGDSPKTADLVTLKTALIGNNGELVLITTDGRHLTRFDMHEGSLPYIYHDVKKYMERDMQGEKAKKIMRKRLLSQEFKDKAYAALQDVLMQEVMELNEELDIVYDGEDIEEMWFDDIRELYNQNAVKAVKSIIAATTELNYPYM